MDRRKFLQMLGFGTVAAAAAATATYDLERLLWVPGEKTIFLPPPVAVADGVNVFSIGDVITFEGRYAINPRTRQATKTLQRFVITDTTTNGQTRFSFRPISRAE